MAPTETEMKQKRSPKGGSSKETAGNESGTMFGVTLLISVSFLSFLVLIVTPAVSGQSLWLVSRASAVTAYVVLTCIVVLGLVLSHPRNKDSWHLHRYLLSWHQALVAVLFPLIAVHLMFTVLDSKSGVTLRDLPLPIHAKYYPLAMTAGALAVYILLFVAVSAGLRKRFRKWLAIHRLSLATWILVWTHGVFGGTDVEQLKWMYILSGLIIFSFALWRYWVHQGRSVGKRATTRTG